jgi:hypothetical protein
MILENLKDCNTLMVVTSGLHYIWLVKNPILTKKLIDCDSETILKGNLSYSNKQGITSFYINGVLSLSIESHRIRGGLNDKIEGFEGVDHFFNKIGIAKQ